MRPLDDIRVLDLGRERSQIAIWARSSRRVGKNAPGKRNDNLRRFGTETECGDTLIWLSESRNKRSITIDFGDPRGIELVRQLVTKVDVVIENFRPGVLERWGLGYESLKELIAGVVLLRVSAYGQSGPLRDQPAFARIAHGFSGIGYLTGEPDGPPVTLGSTSLADYISGLYGAIGVLLALRAREVKEQVHCIDLTLFEPTFRVLDELAPAFQHFGFVRERMGTDTVNVLPHGHYQTKDGHWLAIACTNDEMFARLAGAMGRPELAGEDLYGPQQQRLAARHRVNELVAEWVGSLEREQAVAACREAQVPAGPLYSIAEIFDDPQYAHRQAIATVNSRIGPLTVPGVLPALSATPGEIRWLGPALGEHTDEVLTGLLQCSPEEVSELRADGVV